MIMEVAYLNKLKYKIVLLLTKLIPFLAALCYLLNTILSYIGIDIPLFSLIGGMSILPLIYLIITSFAFKYCIYHRLPIYYIIISDAIAYYDICFGIPISSRSLFSINISIAGLTLLLIIYLKFKICKKH